MKLIKKKQLFASLLFALFTTGSLFALAYSIKHPKNIIPGFAVLQGDCNTDGRVDILDFQLLSNSFGKASGQTGYNAKCDFNTDLRIDILDFQILSNNFGETATPTLTPSPTAAPTTGITATTTPRPTNTVTPTVRPSNTPTPTSPPSGSSIYWGAYIRGAAGNPTYPADYGDVPWDSRTLDLFESNAGKKVSVIHFGQAWKTSSGSFAGFPTGAVDTIRNHGAIPMLGWGSWQLGKGVNQPDFKLTKITSGTYDSYITQFAQSAKAWGHPLFIRFDHEMNIGGQFSWNFSDTWTDPATGQSYKNTPDDFINMWRHVVNIFRAQGANNVTWVWCPNIYFRSGSKALPFMQGYPGDSFVDWNCVDGYNKSTNMTPFANIFTDSYNVMQQKVTGADTACRSFVTACNPKTKPIMIGEWATVEAGDGGTKKANWIKDALLTQLPNNFPAIKAVVWFNWNSSADSLIIESTSTALSGFKTGIASPYYKANNYSGISSSPIPAP